jgi:hypothetical protein
MKTAQTMRLAVLAAGALACGLTLAAAQPEVPEATVSPGFPGALLVATAALVITLAVVLVRALANRQPDHGPEARVLLRHYAPKPARARSPAPPAPPANSTADAGGIEVHEHLDAEDLALALAHFGPRSVAGPEPGAFAAAHPREAMDPWFKLLELYRQSGAREEFETLAARLNANFNVRVPAWDARGTESRPAEDTLEAYPHVIRRLEQVWHREACRDYLATLLVDTRGGQRAGFAKGAVDDILLLVAIQELRARGASAMRRPPRRARKAQPRPAG